MTDYSYSFVHDVDATSSETTKAFSYTLDYPEEITLNGNVSSSNYIIEKYASEWTVNVDVGIVSGSTIQPSITISGNVIVGKSPIISVGIWSTDDNGSIKDRVFIAFTAYNKNGTPPYTTIGLPDIYNNQPKYGILVASVMCSQVNPQPFGRVTLVKDSNAVMNGFILNGTLDTNTAGQTQLLIYVNQCSNDYTISASLTKQYTISASAGTGSTITGFTTPVTAGSSQTVKIYKQAGYKVTNIYLNGVSQSVPSQGVDAGYIWETTLSNIQNNQTISTTTEKFKYTITTSAGSNGSITSSATVDYGSNKTINITPNSGYEVSDVIVDGSSKGKITSYTFNNITANHTISASFKQIEETKYTVTVTTVANGSVTATPTSATAGTTITLSVNPSSGYKLKQISSSPSVTITNNTFTLPANNITLVPEFEEIEVPTYTITVGTSQYGTATASHATASAGTVITMSATAGDGYVLKSYNTQPYVTVINGQFTMPSSNILVTPVFDQEGVIQTSYDIYVNSESTDMGDVSVTGVDESKGLITIKAEAEKGYRFSQWEISSGVCTLTSPYTTETIMVLQDSDVSVIAHFVKDISPTKVNQVHLTITR